MGDRTAESEAQSFSDSARLTNTGAARLEDYGVGIISDEQFRKEIAELRELDKGPKGIVPCKSRSWLYDSRKFQRLETEHGYPAGRMFAPEIVQFGRLLGGGFGRIGQVHDGQLLGPVSESVVIKTLDIAKERGIEDLPILLREARAYEALKKLAGKCLPRFFGSGVLGNQYALVVEKVPGKVLHTLSSQEKAECRDRVLKAYKALHAAGYVQGDVNGSNILVDEERVTIVDLGAAEKVSRWSKKIKAENDAVLELFSQALEIE